jgi:hypothetical protein
MNSLEVECLVSKTYYHRGHYAHFVGVFSSDNIPRKFSKWPASLIANTDSSDEPGEHWVAFYQHRPYSAIEYFDSYGNDPVYYDMNVPFEFESVNTTQLQSETSRVCGHYCVYYVTCRPHCAAKALMHNLMAGSFSVRDQAVQEFVSHQLARYPITPHCDKHEHAQCCVARIYSRRK